jgi:hypothetical protein
MSEQKNQPAFPVFDRSGAYSPGMSLRDWFAGMALSGMLADSEVTESIEASGLASWAYTLANAMLAERQKQPDPTA